MNIIKTPWKISGLSGILFVAISFIASGIGNTIPTYDKDIADLPSWFATHGERYCLAHTLAGLAFLLFYLPFYAGLCEKLKIAEDTPSIWTRVTWAGAILSPAAGSIAGAFIMGIALLQGKASPEVSQFAIASNFYAYRIAGAYGGIALIGAAIVILRTRVFKSWMGWSASAIGVAAILSIGTFVENNPKGIYASINDLAWLAYFLWIAIISVELIRCKDQTHRY